jgi:demethylmenaquinone methyltransferase/2-methoxy-6-polyprenyl-1,4-benzoquinol methylase
MDTTHSAHHPDHGTQEAEVYATMLERMNRFQEPEVRTAIADLHLSPGSRGLDVGCGVGLYALWLAEVIGPTGQVMGIDTVPERVAAAQRLVGTRLTPGRLDFQHGDGTAIAVADRSFDWVWCADVLHHIDDAVVALKEFMRVVRPGGRILIKESQVMSALFLPGYPDLERQLQQAERQFQHPGAGGQSFQERRQRTLASMQAAGLANVSVRTYLVERQAPLDAAASDYIQHVVFERNWGERLRELLGASAWEQRSTLCDATSPQAILLQSDYYCLYPFSLFTAQLPG